MKLLTKEEAASLAIHGSALSLGAAAMALLDRAETAERERDALLALGNQDCDGMNCPPSDEARAQVAALREALLACHAYFHGNETIRTAEHALERALASTEATAREHDARVRAEALEEAALLVGPRNYKLNDSKSDIPNVAREKLHKLFRALAAKEKP